MRSVLALCIAFLALPAGAEDLRPLTGTAIPPEGADLPGGAMLGVEARGPLGALLAEDWQDGGPMVAFLLEIPAGVAAQVSLVLIGGDGAALQRWTVGPLAVPAGQGAVDLGDLALLPDEPLSFAMHLDCGGRSVVAGLAPGAPEQEIRLEIDGTRVTLTAAEAAEGARYVAAESGLWFWTRGGEATLGIDGSETLCTPPPAATYAVRGVGWDMVLTGSQSGMRGGASYVLTQEDSVTEGRLAPPVWAEGAVRLGPLDPGGALVRLTSVLCEAGQRDYPERVEITMGDETLVGCGGDPLPALEGAEWQVEDIGGAGIIDGAHVTLTFNAEGRAFGSGGCNRWSGGYTADGKALTFGPAVATRMACAEALMTLEQAFLTALTQVAGYSIDDTGALVLTDATGGALVTARR